MGTQTSRRTLTPVGARIPGGWLAVALAAAVLVAVAYVSTHAHPAYEGGLYLQIVAEIRAHGYGLPARIPHYTDGGVPFAYPPLAFYAIAIVVDLTGIDPVALMRVLPAAVVVAYLVPYYALADELLASDRVAGFATLLFAVTPPVLQWHVSAGGLVRAPAMLLTLLGLYAGVRRYRSGDRRWTAVAAALFGLTILTHPVYTVFFGWSYLLVYLGMDRSKRGFLDGAAVCLGGLLVAAPWLGWVVATHGPMTFFGAAGTRTTLAGGSWRLLTQFVFPITNLDAVTPFYVAAYAGVGYGLLRRRYLLAGWTLSAAYLLGTPRFTFVAGSMVAAVFVFEFLVPRLSAAPSGPVARRTATLGAIALLATGAAGVGIAYSAGALQTAHGDSPTQPETVDVGDREAMAWAADRTDADATFLVLGDAAEWFPYYAERSIAVSPWGTEWTGAAEFRQHVSLYSSLSDCASLYCLEASYDELGGPPDYLYVPTGEYTIRGDRHERPDGLIADLRASESYDLRHVEEGVLVYEVDPDAGPSWTAYHTDESTGRAEGTAAGGEL